METYKASLDTTSKVITSFVFLLLIFGFTMWFVEDNWYVGLMLSFIPAILITFTYLFKVQSYQITDEKLIIKRPVPMFNKEIPFSEIESISTPEKADFKGTIRTGGVGGLFGYYGYFANKNLGNFTMYATNGENRVLLIVGKLKTKIVISPDDAKMVDALQKHLEKEA